MSSLRDQIETALESATWGSELPTTAHPDHRYSGACGLCQGAVRQIAAVAAEAVQPVLDGKDALVERLKGEISHRSATSLEQQERADFSEAALVDRDAEIAKLQSELEQVRDLAAQEIWGKVGGDSLRRCTQRVEQAEAERDRLKAVIEQAREVLPYLYHQIDEIAVDHPRVAENLQETYRRLNAALQPKETP